MQLERDTKTPYQRGVGCTLHSALLQLTQNVDYQFYGENFWREGWRALIYGAQLVLRP